MDINYHSPNFILTALIHISPKLKNIVQDNIWEEIRSKINHLENNPNDLAVSSQLSSLLWQHNEAHHLFVSELQKQELTTKELMPVLNTLAETHHIPKSEMETLIATTYRAVQWDIDADIISASPNTRNVSLSEHGIDGAESISIKHLRIDFKQLLVTFSAVSLWSGTVIENPSVPIVIGTLLAMLAGVISLPNETMKRMTEKISQQEATILWGFVQVASHRKNMQATAEEIIAKTNEEREIISLNALSDKQCTESLLELSKLGIIRNIDNKIWCLVEEIIIKQ